MELRTLHYFVVLAEELHFGRAAERLPLSQPALSRAIKLMERELGVRLFTRDARGVELTRAGEDILERARATLSAAERLRRTAEQHRRGDAGGLRLGYLSNDIALPASRAILQRFRRRYPGITVEVQRFNFDDQPGFLLERQADIGLLCLPVPGEGLEIMTLAEEERVAVLSADHPLAARQTLTFDDLRYVPVVGHRPEVPRVWHDFWIVDPRPDGTRPIPGPAVNSIEDALAAVAHQDCVAFISAHTYRAYPRQDVVARRVAGLTLRMLGIGWRTGDDNPALRALRSIVTRPSLTAEVAWDGAR